MPQSTCAGVEGLYAVVMPTHAWIVPYLDETNQTTPPPGRSIRHVSPSHASCFASPILFISPRRPNKTRTPFVINIRCLEVFQIKKVQHRLCSAGLQAPNIAITQAPQNRNKNTMSCSTKRPAQQAADQTTQQMEDQPAKQVDERTAKHPEEPPAKRVK